MRASEMIDTIAQAEKKCCRIARLDPERIHFFQHQNLSETQGVFYDEPDFTAFVRELETVLDGRVYLPTAKKILNNYFLWAKSHLT